MTERKAGRVGYRRIAEDLKRKIEAETYAVGEMLPSYDALAAEYDVSKNVARDAIGALNKEGITETSPGIGTVVLHKPSEAPPPAREQLMRQLADMQRQIGEVAAEVAELRREVHAGRQPQPEARRAGRPATQARP